MLEQNPGIDIEALVRRYEPVLRFTQGELFFPMSVEDYVREAALWARTESGDDLAVVADHGTLDLDGLASYGRELNDRQLQLRYVPAGLDRRALRAWRRSPDRPRFSSTSRFVSVGLLGRFIDSMVRLSLVLRGSVPGGLAAAIHRLYNSTGAHEAPHYYARVSADGGYVVLQYWYFYAMNDWRSAFGGVNDHEADWEQVTLYLAPIEDPSDAVTVPGSGHADGRDVLELAWVAFSSHDEVGPDLRRRVDDPDITWAADTHPVVSAGAGSHSGAHLSGEYLVRVEPPILRRTAAVLTSIRRVVFPWTRDRPSGRLGIPYIDYKRGDGKAIGPGTDCAWTMVLIDDATDWVRDFHGLWGLDTEDPFGGERAPAGPRYERNGTIRPSWADPVGWAGLDRVPATPSRRTRALRDRIADLEHHELALTAEIATERGLLEQLEVTVESLPPTVASSRRGGVGATTRAREQEALVGELRARRRSVTVAREKLLLASSQPPPVHPPHAHLRHRAVPDVDPTRPPSVILRFWTEISLSVLLALLGFALLFDQASLWRALLVVIVVVTAVEAFLRGRLFGFLLGLLVVSAIVAISLLLLRNLRDGLGALAITGAVVLLVANIRAMLVRR